MTSFSGLRASQSREDPIMRERRAGRILLLLQHSTSFVLAGATTKVTGCPLASAQFRRQRLGSRAFPTVSPAFLPPRVARPAAPPALPALGTPTLLTRECRPSRLRPRISATRSA